MRNKPDTSKRTRQKSIAAVLPLKEKPHVIHNQLFYGDNLEILRKYVKDQSVDLCYIDPPFNSNRTYNQIYNNIGKEDKAQAQAFIDTWTWDERAEEGLEAILKNNNGLYTKQCVMLIIGLQKVLGKSSLLAYLISMCQRVAEIHRVLKPTGSFFFHCDPTASHYLKLLLDSIFLPRGGDLRNEIVWCYTGPGSPGMRQFMRKHDIVFWYNKTENWIFNRDDIRIAHSKKTKANYKEGLVGSGFVEADHKIHDKGKVPEDWWQIAIAPRGKEYLGYPTQKPEALLDRIIRACSNKGDVILDAYCGCGTTVAVAERLERHWIGIDITYQSISLVLKRLEEHFGINTVRNIDLNGVPEDFASAQALANKKDDRTRKEFEKWAVLSYSNNRAMINEKKGGDGGIDGIAIMVDINRKTDYIYPEILFSVKSDKNLSPNVIRDLFGTMEREGAAMGIFITLYPMPNLVKESKRYGIYTNKLVGQSYPRIEVISVQEILDGRTMKLPTNLEVMKKAEGKARDVQTALDF